MFVIVALCHIFVIQCRLFHIQNISIGVGSLFLVDETAAMVGGSSAWVWMTYEPFSRRILGLWL